jgi:DNA ligase-1|tara:strand:- start:17177 stop:19327 length:2151 start_codon:yes stop_codon:yes gene_type:complete
MQSGFNSFENFRKYKENNTCFTGYKAVYPEVQVISTSDDKTYIDNLKVMTAQNLYDSKTGNIIKLSDKLSKELKILEPPINWWASEKWDGIRALWDGEKIISRGSGVGKPKVYTYVPEWFKLTLPPGIALDGEIWIGRGLFQKTSRLSTIKPGKSYTQTQINDIWAGKENPPVIFKVFDIPTEKSPFEQRMKMLQTIVKDRKDCWDQLKYENKKVFPLQFTDQVKIKSMEQLVNLYTKLTSAGAEGIMIRASGSPYETKRSKYMLKYKIKEDAECIVRGYTPGEGRLKGLLGSLNCEILKDSKPSGIFTQIGTGLTDSERENYIISGHPEEIPIGSIVSFSYMEMTNDGVPRHPVYRGIRDDIIKQPVSVSVSQVKQMLTKIMNKIAAAKEQNWSFKVKYYKQAIGTLNDTMVLNSVEDYINVFRENGMQLKDEENFKAKNGTWKSTILQKIDTILKTGEVDNISTDLEAVAVENLTKVPGIGPAKASELYRDEEITTITELKEIYSINKKVINDKQAIGLEHYDDLQKRIPRSEMDNWGEILKDTFDQTLKELNETGKLVITGSYRREKNDSGDIDALITTNIHNKDLMNTFYTNLIKKNIISVENVISKGPIKMMAVATIDEIYRHLDIFYYTADVYPFALLFTTGSKEFNVSMRNHALKLGYSLNERNLTKGSTTGRLVSKDEYMLKIGKDYPETEHDIFKFLDYKFIDPADR